MTSRHVMTIATTLTFIFTGLLGSTGFGFQESSPGVIHALLVADSDSSLGDSVKKEDVRQNELCIEDGVFGSSQPPPTRFPADRQLGHCFGDRDLLQESEQWAR